MRKLFFVAAFLLATCVPSFPGFAHVQGSVTNGGTGLTTFNITLGANPTTGNIVLVGFTPDAAVTSLTVKDGNNNSYTVSSGSPSTFQTGAGQVWMAYLLSAPANANATLTLTWTTGVHPTGWADEFSVTGGTASFGGDAKANTGTAGTAINTPSITPAASNDLLYAAAAAGGTISSPTAGGTQGVWTGAAGAISNGDMAEYDLSASSATAVNFTQSSGGWSAMALDIKFTPGASSTGSLMGGATRTGGPSKVQK